MLVIEQRLRASAFASSVLPTPVARGRGTSRSAAARRRCRCGCAAPRARPPTASSCLITRPCSFVLERREPLALGLGEPADRDAGGPADHGRDLRLVDHGVVRRAPPSGPRRAGAAPPAHLVAGGETRPRSAPPRRPRSCRPRGRRAAAAARSRSTDRPSRRRSRAPAWSMRSIALSGSTRSVRYRLLSSTAAVSAASV